MGIPTATGNQSWSTEAIQRILQNEKYMGDVLLQKTYTADFIEGKVKKNNGELPQYYIKDNHPAIIPREMFYQIQEEIARRKAKSPPMLRKPRPTVGGLPANTHFRKDLSAGTAAATSKGDMEHPRAEANCLAMHQPAGMRTKGLQGLPQPQGR